MIVRHPHRHSAKPYALQSIETQTLGKTKGMLRESQGEIEPYAEILQPQSTDGIVSRSGSIKEASYQSIIQMWMAEY